MEQNEVRRGGLVGPLILIGIGVIVLLTNLGYVDWNVWAVLFRIWPVFLIAIGLDLLIGRRTALGSVLVLLLIVAVFAVGIWLAWGPISGRALETESIAHPLQGAEQAEVQIGRSAGIIEVGALVGDDRLVEGRIALRRGEEAVEDFYVRGETAYFSLRNRGNVIGPVVSVNRTAELWTVDLNPRVPLDLEVNCAAGEAQLDLEELVVTHLDLSLAVGQGTVTLPQDGSMEGSISGAIGQLDIIIPRGQEARIVFSTALVARDVPSAFRRNDDTYTSAGYDGAESRIDLNVGLVLGQVNVIYGE